MSSLVAGIPGLMAGLLVRTTVVLALALMATLAAKHRPAAFRHVLLSAALIGLVFLPLLTLAPVGWRSPLLPRWMTVPGPRAAEPAVAARPAAAATELRPAGRVAGPAAGDPANGLGGNVVIMTVTPADNGATSSPPTGVESPGMTRPVPGVRGPGLPRSRTFPLGLLLAGLWLAGFAALVSRLAIGLAGAARLTNEAVPLDQPAWRVLLERFLALVSLKRPVLLRSHPEVFMPLTWGWRKPVVLLPEGADEWSDDERSSALCHELSHIKRADFLVMLLVRTSLALFWWNPLCWAVYRELIKEQEIACDELVLRAGIRPSTYAASLLAFRRSVGFRWDPSAALLGFAGRSSFQERLAAILRQKLTFMEVKMKTKILLALALVLAVAIIGTARPAVGREIPKTRTVVAETALPAAAPLDAVLEAQAAAQTVAETAVVQEKQKEQEKAQAEAKAKEAEKAAKEKKAVEKTIVIKPVVVDGKPIEIVITEGDQVKKIMLDKPVTITKGHDGETIILSVDGKEIQVLKGEPLRLEIKGGEVLVLKDGQPLEIAEGRALKHGEATAFTVVTKGDEPGGAVVYSFTPRGHADAEGQTFTLVKEAGGGKVVVEKHLEGEPVVAYTVKEAKGEKVWVAKEVVGEPAQMTWVAKDGTAFAVSRAADEKMLEKVRALQEQVQAIKAKKMDITALEQSLKKLEADLQANEEKLKELQVKLEETPGHYVVAKKVAGDGTGDNVTVWITEKGHAVKPEGATAVVRPAGDGDATINIILTGKTGDEGKKAYERALAELKKRLPEGYRLAGQSYDPENGTMIFGIAAAEGMKTDETVVRKLVEALQAEIKK
jgi:beta-lactamase regulating signal transducer with metallopeptidase domain